MLFACNRFSFLRKSSVFFCNRLTSSITKKGFNNVGAIRKLSAVSMKPFPSLKIHADGFSAQGPFAEAQAAYLNPDNTTVSQLDDLLAQSRMGVVAHFYMDPELQGSLNKLQWPHVFIADSLAMGDAAVEMAKTGQVDSIACLGVDFMSEGVRAVLDNQGFEHIPVYRLSEKKIGCSLAESAERLAYMAYLKKAAETPNSLHVVYINTSLVTKAQAQSIIPTITCTSSNVVKTVLSAFAQVPDLHVWYGPDTYMGENLYNMFQKIASLPDEEIKKLHPDHNKETLKGVLARFDYFKQGMCVVHHMFGDDVVKTVKSHYEEAYHTAHLEVPGEMFELAMDAQQRGAGVVGSTSNILNFITDKTKEAISSPNPSELRDLSFVLGTEAGMVTSIVKGVQDTLKAADKDLGVEIIFPVASEAIAQSDEASLGVVPGVQGGEGCSTAGGCATCPYMKMNSLDALMDVAQIAGTSTNSEDLHVFLPQRHTQKIDGKSIMELGAQPILNMRSFMKNGTLSDDLVRDIVSQR